MKENPEDSWLAIVALVAIGLPLGLLSGYLFAFELDPGSGSMAYVAASLGVMALTCFIGAVAVTIKRLRNRNHGQ